MQLLLGTYTAGFNALHSLRAHLSGRYKSIVVDEATTRRIAICAGRAIIHTLIRQALRSLAKERL